LLRPVILAYSRGRGQRDLILKPSEANSLRDPILKILNTKKRLVEWLKFKPLSTTRGRKKL
jgi:hypothetical protein